MKSLDGMKSFFFSFIKSNSIAPAIAFAVQLPSCPWSYTGGMSGDVDRSTEAGSDVTAGKANLASRMSGSCGRQP